MPSRGIFKWSNLKQSEFEGSSSANQKALQRTTVYAQMLFKVVLVLEGFSTLRAFEPSVLHGVVEHRELGETHTHTRYTFTGGKVTEC